MRPECIIASGDVLGEVPIWNAAENAICWLDVTRARLQSLDVMTLRSTIYQFPGTSAGGWALRASGNAVVALDTGVHDFTDGEVGRVLARFPSATLPTHRVNEAAVDCCGRLWLGLMERGGHSPRGGLFMIDARGRVHEMLSGITIPNGICFDPDDTTLYFTDSAERIIWAYSFESENCRLSKRRVFCDLSAEAGMPDGAAVDAEGYIWCAMFKAGQILRINPRGRIVRRVSLPVSKVTSLAFGGPRLNTLYITTASGKLTPDELASQPLAGGLFAMDVEVEGKAVFKYCG